MLNHQHVPNPAPRWDNRDVVIGSSLDVCRFEEAQRLCKSAIMILEKSVGEEDVNVAAALSLQATCLQ